jgi:hypothetical protein
VEFSRDKVRPTSSLGVCLVGLAVGVLVAGHHAVADAQEYSAYSDPGKTALSVILSEQDNLREFQREFGLDDAALDKALVAVREENEKLAVEYAESEKIVASNRSLSDEKVANKIAASDYDESVEDTIAETKDSVEALLPEGDQPELKAWVDEQWRAEAASPSNEGSARLVETKAGRKLVCKVFATQYKGHTRFEAALPHRGLKFGDRPEVPIKRGKRTIRPRVKEVGPWNTYDNYWRTGKERTMWKDLPKCIPEARAAYYNDYNNGRDEFGRKVLNPAGVDLTPRAAKRLGLDRYQNAWVYVKFPWVRR